MSTYIPIGAIRVPLPADVTSRTARASGGGVEIELAHTRAGAVGRIRLMQRPGGLQVEGVVLAGPDAADADWRKTLVDGIIHRVSAAIDLHLSSSRAEDSPHG